MTERVGNKKSGNFARLNFMKRLLLVLSCLIMFINAQAQYDEFGVFGGSFFIINGASFFNPKQMDQNVVNFLPHLDKISPTVQLLYRHSFDSRQAVSGTFSYSHFYELAARYEINFRNFILGSKRNYYSTYIFGGLAYAIGKDSTLLGMPEYVDDTASIPTMRIATIPFGMGFKYSVGESLGLSAEIGLRKNLGFSSDQDNGFLPVSQPFYGFIGVAATYKFSFTNKHKCRNLEF
ncbi:MAG: DUF6089 family protein [Bacteroidales bacterium]|nr:hypothetical protein [Lentimicrobiaceae bacterium]MDD5693686.1 DUF6089 family protein [Bacteroidales bacterium]